MSKSLSPERRQSALDPPSADRRSGHDRRRDRRIKLDLETAVPVVIRSGGLVQWGLARNISEGGMLIEIAEAPPIGSRVEVKIAGIQGSLDAPESVLLHGEVRHHVAWRVGSPPSRLHAIGLRFVPEPEPLHAGWLH